MKFTTEELMSKLPLPANKKWKDGVWDAEAFSKGDVSLLYFAPKMADYQTFHQEDEFYFVVGGSGGPVIGDEIFTFEKGDAFYVPAKVQHHFENFTDDFATWAVFF